jgi:hypothetical protein
MISYLLFVFTLIIFIRTQKKLGGENNGNELVLETFTRKKSEHTRSQVKNNRDINWNVL